MKDSDGNLFDHGKSSQAEIIKPYMCSIRQSLSGIPLDGAGRTFFIDQLRSCLAKICEYEERPKWVNNVPSYRMKSEIATFLSLFSVIDLPAVPSEDDQQHVNDFYEEVKKFGENRKWDMQILHLQFIRAMGSNVQNYIMKLIVPRKLELIDYN